MENPPPTSTTLPEQILPQPHLKKKSKKKRSGKTAAAKRRRELTGYEEFFADSPITPAESQEEKELYSSDLSFVQRIEECIRRYRSKRRMNSVRANIFNKYLSFGGVNCEAKAFTSGYDPTDMQDLTTAEIRDLQARDYLTLGGNRKYYDPAQAEHWVVDFSGVVKGFLSQEAPDCFGLESLDLMEECALVVRNFLSYILSHDVCPEYGNDIFEARRVCDAAKNEFEKILHLSNSLPSPFHDAASVLFGADQSTCVPADGLDPGPKLAAAALEADRVFKTAVAAMGDASQFQETLESRIQVATKQHGSFEVVDIIFPETDIVEVFQRAIDIRGDAGTILPLGKLVVRPWQDPSAPPEDESDSETEVEEETLTTFWLEVPLLRLCFPQMHFHAEVYTLSCGIRYFESIGAIKCSFFTYLNNAKMTDWKEPRPIDPKSSAGEEDGDENAV